MFKNKKNKTRKSYLYVNPDKRSVNWRETKIGNWGSHKIKIRLGGCGYFIKVIQFLNREKDKKIKTENEHVKLFYEAKTQNLFLYCSPEYIEEDFYDDKKKSFFVKVIEKKRLFLNKKTIRNLGNINIILNGLELMTKASYIGCIFQIDGFVPQINLIRHGKKIKTLSFEKISHYINTHKGNWTECLGIKKLKIEIGGYFF